MTNPAADFPTTAHTPTDVSAFAATDLGASSPTHTSLEGKQEEEIEAITKRLLKTALNVREYGATGDGVTDDTAALQACLTAAATLENRDVFIPPGVYNYNTTLTVPSGVHVYGAGYDGTTGAAGGTILYRTADVVGLLVQGTSILSGGPMHWSVTFDGIWFWSPDAHTATIMEIRAVATLVISDCRFFSCAGTQLLLHECFDSDIQRTRFDWGGDTAGVWPAVDIVSGDYTSVKGVVSNGYEYSNHIRFEGCTWESDRSTALGIRGVGGNKIVLSHCHLECQGTDYPLVLIDGVTYENATLIHFDNVTMSKQAGGLGALIPCILQMSNCSDITGLIYFYYNPGVAGPALTTFVNIENSRDCDLFVVVTGDGIDTMVNQSVVTTDGENHESIIIRGHLTGPNTTGKTIMSKYATGVYSSTVGAPYVRSLQETITRAAMTDGGGTSGYKDFANTLPVGAIVLGYKAVVTTGFIGDTSATVQVGASGAVAKFSAATTGSCFAAGTIGSLADPSTSLGGIAATVTPRITVTSAADFANVSAGSMTVAIYYIDTYVGYHGV